MIVVVITPTAPSGAQPTRPTQRTIGRELLTIAIIPSIHLICQLPADPLRQCLSLLLIQQLLHSTSIGTAVIDFLTPDQSSWHSRVDALPNFPFPIEVGQRYVEAMDVRWNDCQKEEDAVEDDILVQAGEHHDGEGWEEDIENTDDQAFEHCYWMFRYCVKDRPLRPPASAPER